jgi:hypothetical protein
MKRTVALLTCLALMIPGAAVASANSTTSNYGPHSSVKNVTASRNKCSSGSGSSGSTSSGSSGSASGTCVSNTETAQVNSLPFTGLDVGALAAGAVLLLGAGIVLRRVSATSRT